MFPLRLFSGLCFSVLLTANALAANTTATMKNLQAAFNGESNAHARYLAFSKKADAEGYKHIASLFRAAARAEEVHANNHAAVIKKLGGVPEAKLETPDVKSTKENLEASIKGETYERDQMYPEFLTEARKARNTEAIQTFNYAKTAEAEHAKLYAEALKGMGGAKNSAGVTYYVCPVCGFTVAKVDFAKCPSCFSPKEKYESVS